MTPSHWEDLLLAFAEEGEGEEEEEEGGDLVSEAVGEVVGEEVSAPVEEEEEASSHGEVGAGSPEGEDEAGSR